MGPVAYFSLCLLGCLIFNPSLEGAQAGPCPRGWLLFHGYCYGYFTQGKTWIEAEAHCQHQRPGAHLVSIHSAGENNMLAHYIKRYHKIYSFFWIGLWDLEANQCWRWSDNSPFTFRAWDKGQPNNLVGNEHCAVLFYHKGFPKWHDYPCDSKFAFMCKRKA
ncbi:C-type lectin BpLec-like [Mauremys mutica]|uniref:C-type lectin BpLec-like n=1 Tax=Mauremys mutica TaxID=74926 RepID=UPI001D149EE3|nr:C-type lectin BpLec-like [Mauremys mutica]